MPKPPRRDSVLDNEDKYDYERIQSIVDALEYLRAEALSTNSEEIYTLINSTFNVCFVLYYMFLRTGHITANEN